MVERTASQRLRSVGLGGGGPPRSRSAPATSRPGGRRRGGGGGKRGGGEGAAWRHRRTPHGLAGRRRAAPAPRRPRPAWATPHRHRQRPGRPPQRDLEDVVGGSVLAWLGGVAVLAGLAFLLTIAVSRGWIGEGALRRLAGVLSAGLLGTGVRLRERKGRTEASLAAAAVGIARAVRHARRRRSRLSPRPGPARVRRRLRHRRVRDVSWRSTGARRSWAGSASSARCRRPPRWRAFGGGGMVFEAIAFAATIGVVVSQRWTRPRRRSPTLLPRPCSGSPGSRSTPHSHARR